MKRDNFDWFLGRKGGARDIGETGVGQWLLAALFVAGVVTLIAFLART